MDKLLDILHEIKPDVDFEMEDALIDDGILTSFDIIALVNALNDEFDIEIGAMHLKPSNFNNAESIFNLVQELMD